MLEPTSGVVRYEGRDLGTLSAGQLRRIRAGAQLIFDPVGMRPLIDMVEEEMEQLRLVTG